MHRATHVKLCAPPHRNLNISPREKHNRLSRLRGKLTTNSRSILEKEFAPCCVCNIQMTRAECRTRDEQRIFSGCQQLIKLADAITIETEWWPICCFSTVALTAFVPLDKQHLYSPRTAMGVASTTASLTGIPDNVFHCFPIHCARVEINVEICVFIDQHFLDFGQCHSSKKNSCSVERKNKKPAAPVQRHLLSGARINSGRDIRRRTCLTLDSLLTIGSFIILWLYGRQRATTPFAQGESHAHGKKFHLP